MKSHRRRSRHIRALIFALAACAALAAPAAAEPGADYPQPTSAKIGDTPADFAQSVAPAPKAGDTPLHDPGASRASVKAKGPYGMPIATRADVVKAKGPYGMTIATGSQDTTRAAPRVVGASGRDGTNGWRTAAISGAALLAALALGSGLLLSARRRPPRMGT